MAQPFVPTQQPTSEQLQLLEKLKGSFLDAVSHELRTPLSSVLGFAEFLEDELGGPLSPQQHAFVTEILKGGRRLQELIDDLLSLSQLNSGAIRLLLQPTDLCQTIRDTAAIFRGEAEKRALSLSLSIPASTQPIPVDPDRIGEVIFQLLSNALKFTPPGGHVTVSLTEDVDGYTVAVKDDGIGISAADQARLFNRFFQANASSTRVAGGAGIGLALSKSLVEAHGGFIGCTSEPGRGTCFWFTLPKPRPSPPEFRVTFAPEGSPLQ